MVFGKLNFKAKMILEETKIEGVKIITLEPFLDERGTFSRQFCKEELQKNGIDFEICQCNISKNPKKGTLRGLHFQRVPYGEPKMISCFKGAIFDVIVDLRTDSPTYLDWVSVELTEDNNKIVYIPSGFAHGFQTLVDDTTVFYQNGSFFKKEYYDGLRWNDPKIGIDWPVKEYITINERDSSYELL